MPPRKSPTPEVTYAGLRLHKTADLQPDGSKTFAGLRILGHRDYVKLATKTVQKGIEEGWITADDGFNAVYRPGGPKHDPWRVTHTFMHYPTLTIHTLDGNYKYDVVYQPDKYHQQKPGTDVAGDPTARVDWFYLLDRQVEEEG